MTGTTLVLIVVNAEGLLSSALIAAIIIQALLSWFAPAGGGRLSLLLHDLTDPILTPIRRTIPPMGMLDLSPMVAIILVYILVGKLLVSITLRLAGL